MEGILSSTDKQSMVSSFLEIAVGQTAETARQFLQATSWKLEEAIQLFYVGNEGGVAGSSILSPPTGAEHIHSSADQSFNDSEKHIGAETLGQLYEDDVRPPLPVIREALYDDAILYGTTMGYQPEESGSSMGLRNLQEVKSHDVWESEEGAASTSGNPRDNLASLYRPPYHLMFIGSFEKAKGAACSQDKWLIVNLQSTKEFSSHMLNRDTWANEAVSQTITTNFIFWQVYDDTTEGQKVCTYYKLESIPAVLVIDPITGQKMNSWFGMVQPERLLEDLLRFMDGGPRDHHVTLSHKRPRGSPLAASKLKEESYEDEEDEEVQRALAVSLESMKESVEVASDDTEKQEEKLLPTYPPLPEEPKGDRNLICRVGVRLPNGRRLQRSFLRADPIQLLWSFCYSELEAGETKAIKLTHAIPGASKSLDYDIQMTFEESGLANSMISVTWEA